MDIKNCDQLIDQILKPINVDYPCGSWSRYTKEFMTLRQDREEDNPDLPMGDWERPLIKADWNKITEKCIGFLQNNSKDLLVVVWLCEALVRTHQINGLRIGLLILNKLISEYWEIIWPIIDEDDAEARVAPFVWLNTALVTRMNQSIVLLQPTISRTECIHLIDWEKAIKDNLNDGITREKIRGSTNKEDIDWLLDIKNCSEKSLIIVKEISTKLDQFLKAQSPSLNILKKTIESIYNFSTSIIKSLENEKKLLSKPEQNTNIKNNENIQVKDEVMSHTMNLVNKNFKYELESNIKTRDEAYNALQNIADFLQKIEPHSPTPYLINRAIKWKDMNLEELTKDAREENLLSVIFGLSNIQKK